jgi:opacity protein-like surface antigen
MKRIYIIMFVLTIGHHCSAQQSGQNEWGISFNNYFEVDSTSEASVNLYAKPYYINTSWQSKLFVIDNILSMREKKVVYVSYGHKREIWGKDARQTVRLLDTLDMNTIRLKDAVQGSQKLIRHPMFFYFGGQSMLNSDYLNFSFNVRMGFFLLLNKWDLALSQGLNISDTGEGGTTTINVPIGLSSKYYFPKTIKGQRISPYLGGGIGYAYVHTESYVSDYNTEEEWQPDYSALAGVSWALGPGSLDIGIQYGKVSKFGISIGYTFFPGRK